MRKILSALLVFALMLTLPYVNSRANTDDESFHNEYECYDDLFVVDYLGDDELEWIQQSYNISSDSVEIYSTSWSMYGSNYCFTGMNEAEKEFYNRLDEVVMYYMNSNADAVLREKDGNYYIKGARFSDVGISKSDAIEIAKVYIYQNPQYYFINKWILPGDDEIFLGCFEDFADGDTRLIMTDKVFAKIDKWVSEVSNISSEYGQALKIHDIVCDNIVYKHNNYDQSLYSAVMLGETVCAGYAKLYSVIANALGIDSIGIISNVHAWNKVNIDGKWYNIDTTWDDNEKVRDYFCRSDAFFLESKEHIPIEVYDGLLPEASMDHVNLSAALYDKGIYHAINDREKIVVGMVTDSTPGADVEYSWYVNNDGDRKLMSDWQENEWLWWYPEKWGTYTIECNARIIGNNASTVKTYTSVDFHPNIKGICQIPYQDGNFLIGVESYDNIQYSYELLILDCTLLAKNEPAWIYSTDKKKVEEGNAFWTVWKPKYGYYWTLFRVFDEEGNLIDEKCYGFVNT